MQKEQLIQSVLQDNSLQEILGLLQGMQGMRQQNQQGALNIAQFQDNQTRQQFDMQSMRENTELARNQTEQQMRLAEQGEKRAQASEGREDQKHRSAAAYEPIQRIAALTQLISSIMGTNTDRKLQQQQLDMNQAELDQYSGGFNQAAPAQDPRIAALLQQINQKQPLKIP